MSYRDAILAEPALVNYYELGEASGNFADSKGTNTGTANGTITYGVAGIPGSSSNAITPNGSSGYISISRQISDDFTIEFWFKTSNSAPSGSHFYDGWGLVNAEVSGFVNDFGSSLVSGGGICAGTGNPDTMLLSPSTSYNDGAWHHVVFTRVKSSGAIGLFVDGQVVARGTGGTQSLTSPSTIAIARILSGGGFFNGSLDEVALYSAALSDSDIRSHYLAGMSLSVQALPFRTAPRGNGPIQARSTLKLLWAGGGALGRDLATNTDPVLDTSMLTGYPAASSSCWGAAGTFSATTGGIKFPATAITASPERLTLAAVARISALGVNSPCFVGTATGTLGGGYSLSTDSYGQLQLRKPGVSALASGLYVAPGDWLALMASIVPGTQAVTFRVYNYDASSYRTASGTASGTARACGTPVVAEQDNSGGTSFYTIGDIACAVVDETIWTEADFLRFVADPFWMGRSASRMPLLSTVASSVYSASASCSVVLSAGGSSTLSHPISASDSVVVTATAAGVRSLQSGGLDSVVVTATAAGVRSLQSGGLDLLVVTATALGSSRRLVAGSDSLVVTASAAGARSVPASGSDSLVVTASASETSSRLVVGLDSLVVSASASEMSRRLMVGSDSVVVTATASEESVFRRSGQQSLVVSVSASRNRQVRGIASSFLRIGVSTPQLNFKYVAGAEVSLRFRAGARFRGETAPRRLNYLGRFQAGQEVPLRLAATLEVGGDPLVPVDVPVVRIYCDGVFRRQILLPVDFSDPAGRGRFLGSYVLGDTDPPGRYVAVYLYGINGQVRAAADIWEMVPGGDPAGPVISAYTLNLPDGDVVLHQWGSGRLAAARGPYLDEGL